MRSADSNIEASLVDRRLANERQLFIRQHPKSQELFARSERTLLRGVPMSWMSEWHGGFPVFLAEAHGAELTDVDGITYADFCMGDTAAMAGHTPAATVKAVNDRVRRGSTAMLPTEGSAVSSPVDSDFRSGSSRYRRPTPTAGSCAWPER